MSKTITLLFTKRRANPVSWLIRWALPRSRFALALSSHCIIDAGAEAIEATMLHGVRAVSREVALRGQTVVRSKTYAVEDAEAGLAFVRSQVCTYQPKVPRWLPTWAALALAALLTLRNNNYDFGGALGLGINPDRNWADPSKWWCYELGAAAIRAAGRPVFSDLSHITETALLALE